MIGTWLTSVVVSTAILGAWQFDGIEFDEQFYPPPSQNFKLVFTFYDDHQHRLRWSSSAQGEFCERTGPYTFNSVDATLEMRVTWLHPENSVRCSDDPDMRMGQHTVNKIKLSQDHLGLMMTLNGRPMVYRLRRL